MIMRYAVHLCVALLARKLIGKVERIVVRKQQRICAQL